MKNDLNLTDFLKDVFSSFDKKVENSGLVSICVEIPFIDLFQVYELFINKYHFLHFGRNLMAFHILLSRNVNMLL